MLHVAEAPFAMAGFRAAAGAGSGNRRAVQENILATRDLTEAVRNLDRVPTTQRTSAISPQRTRQTELNWPSTSAIPPQRAIGTPTPSFTDRSSRQTELNWPQATYRPFNPHSSVVKRSQKQQLQHRSTKKKRIAMWEKEFICLAKIGQTHVPTPLEKAELYRAGLGMKSLLLLEYGDSWEFHDEVLKKYPKLTDGGGYELLRTCGSSRELNVIPPPLVVDIQLCM